MTNCKILIIEDEKPDAEVLTSKLRRLGYRNIRHCYTSISAITCLKKESFDIIIVDKELKGSALDGIGLSKFIKDNTSTPLFFVTGHSDYKSTDEILQVGASAHVVKPISLSQLKVALHHALENKTLINQSLVALRKTAEETVFFRLRDRTQQAIRYSLIQFVVWSGRIGRIYLSDDTQFEIHLSANDALVEYFNEELFIRANKSTLINILNIRYIKNQKIHFKGIEKLGPIIIGKVYAKGVRGIIMKHNLRVVQD